jgi:hypothetical protein
MQQCPPAWPPPKPAAAARPPAWPPWAAGPAETPRRQRPGLDSDVGHRCGQLPRHRRRRSPQPGRDLPVRLAGGYAAADLFAFGHGQTPQGAARWVLLHPPVWGTKARTDGPRLPSRRAISRSDSPRRHRAQTSSCSAADSPQDPTTSTADIPVIAGSDATTHLRPRSVSDSYQ